MGMLRPRALSMRFMSSTAMSESSPMLVRAVSRSIFEASVPKTSATWEAMKSCIRPRRSAGAAPRMSGRMEPPPPSPSCFLCATGACTLEVCRAGESLTSTDQSMRDAAMRTGSFGSSCSMIHMASSMV